MEIKEIDQQGVGIKGTVSVILSDLSCKGGAKPDSSQLHSDRNCLSLKKLSK